MTFLRLESWKDRMCGEVWESSYSYTVTVWMLHEIRHFPFRSRMLCGVLRNACWLPPSPGFLKKKIWKKWQTKNVCLLALLLHLGPRKERHHKLGGCVWCRGWPVALRKLKSSQQPRDFTAHRTEKHPDGKTKGTQFGKLCHKYHMTKRWFIVKKS